MKRKNNHHLRRNVLAWLLAVVTLGCTDEMRDFYPDDAPEGLKLEFQATIDQVNTSRADESGFADGDRFGVFVVNYKDGQPGTLTLSSNQVNNVAIGYNADSNTWTPATDIYWLDDQTRADVYGYYPFNNALDDVGSYNFEVRYDQTIPAEDGKMGSYEASDFLWAKAPGAKPGEKVSLSFAHALAGVKVVLQKGSGFDGDEWEKLPKIVTVDNTIRTSTVDLSIGTVTPSGSYDRNIVMNPDGDGWRAVVVPQTVEAGKSVIGVTIDGVAYTLDRKDAMTYTAGKLHNFTIEVNCRDTTGDYTLNLVNEDITAWECDNSSHDFESNAYLVVDVQKEGTLKECITALGADYTTVNNLKVNGRITANDFYFMGGEMTHLKGLNLKDVKIVNVDNFQTWPNKNDNHNIVDNKIPDLAFLNSSLNRIILPDNLEIIGRRSFEGTNFFSSIIIPNTVKEIQMYAFWCTKGLFEIVLPDEIEVIGDGAFGVSGASIDIKLPQTLKYIGYSAFSSTPNVHGTFVLPSGLEYLGESAFSGCGTNLDGDIVIPEKIKVIPKWTFCDIGFRKAPSLVLHDGVEKIDESAFSGLRFSSPIVFGKGLTSIQDFAFSSCKFDGKVIFSSRLLSIGREAFGNSDIDGVLEIPAGVETLNGSAFSGTKIEKLILGDNFEQLVGDQFSGCFSNCQALRYIEMGKNISYIAQDAFAGCQGIQMIVCLSKDPPALGDNSFSDVDVSHCVVEVPEKSVEAYRRDPSWGRFWNITPHRELNISLSEISCLNKGISRNLILTAEGEWEVAEAPSWIHVTPDHAAHKEEITIKVDPLSTESGYREGQVTFRLKESGYTNYITVRQYDYQYEEDKEIVLQTATGRGRPIPVYIVGEGYGAESIADGKYMQRVSETVDHLFSIEPYKSYRDMFAISTAISLSPDDGAPDIYSANQSKFSFIFPSIDNEGANAIKSYIAQISGDNNRDEISGALIIVLSNYQAFSGSSYHDEYDGSVIACVGVSNEIYPYDNRGLVQNIVGGEAFGGLATETVCHNEFLKGCTCPGCSDIVTFYKMKSLGMFENVTTSDRISDCPWREFIFHEKYSAMVDMYEGGYRHLRGVWRSEIESVMSTYIPYYNTVSRYAIYKQIMNRAGLPVTIDDFIANDKIELP